MPLPDRKTFVKLTQKGNLVPVYDEILADLDTPVSAFLKLGERPAFLLESVEGGETWARYSFLGLRPSLIIKGNGKRLTLTDQKGSRTIDVDDPLEYLKTLMSKYCPVHVDGLPRFYGGLVGYMGYDMVRFMEELPARAEKAFDAPDMFYMLTDTMLVFDNLKQTIKVVASVHIDGQDAEAAYDEAQKRIAQIVGKLRAPALYHDNPGAPAQAEQFTSSFGSQESFEQAVLKCKEYILAGDILQVVLSQRFHRKCSALPLNIYRALRVINPSPYMYYLDTGEFQIVGSSPEILVRLEDEKITVRPIAGTRRRGANEAEDKVLEYDLKADPKEVAEHIMLVDLGRNDVGRVSKIGSVKVTDLMAVERYSHVMHMVSNVEATLAQGLDAFDVLRACFPAGTVSGAPKVRAMQIIDELEPHLRGPYAGSVGYFSYSGNLDTCITIRTLMVKDGVVYVQAGAGIVADSVPEKEYQETLNKAMGMMRAAQMAEEKLG